MNWLRCLAALAMGLFTTSESLAAPAPPSVPAPQSKAPRAAILHFGPPEEWRGTCGDIVGVQIAPEAWRDAIPLLEKDRVGIVVVRVRSGGGDARAATTFHELFTKELSPRFRLVFWVDQAIESNMCAPLYVLSAHEMYMTPKGLVGTALGFRGCPLMATRDPMLEDRILSAERASKEGGRPPELGLALVIQTALSATKRQDGSWEWRSDEKGTDIINTAGHICTINAATAVRYGLAQGIASSREDLVRAMGLERVEWTGKEASSAIEQSMRERDAEAKDIQKRIERYTKRVEGWTADTPPALEALAEARAALDEVRNDVQRRPAAAQTSCVDKEWIARESKRLDELDRSALEAPARGVR